MPRSIIDRTLSQNKPRLYLALYPRGDVDLKFHTGLLLLPKNPVPSEKEAIRFHVVNKVVKSGNVKEEWEFDPIPPVVHNRTYSLLSVALLGKISISEGKLKELLSQVPVKQDDKSWRCRHWVWDAMEHLAKENVIELPIGAEKLWDKLFAFSNSFKWCLKEPIPCLDNKGDEIKSEIGPAENSKAPSHSPKFDLR